MKWNGKRLYLALGAVALIAILFKPLANFAGYCAAENRFLTEDEIVAIVTGGVFEHYTNYPPKRYNLAGDYIKNPIKYASLETFMNASKDCCRLADTSIDEKFIPPSLLSKLQGLAVASVRVKYKVEDVTSTGEPGFIEVFRTVTNCGKTWNEF